MPLRGAATTKSGVYGQTFMIKFPSGEQAAAAKEARDAHPTTARTWTEQDGLAHILKVMPDRSFPVRMQGKVLGALWSKMLHNIPFHGLAAHQLQAREQRRPSAPSFGSADVRPLYGQCLLLRRPAFGAARYGQPDQILSKLG